MHRTLLVTIFAVCFFFDYVINYFLRPSSDSRSELTADAARRPVLSEIELATDTNPRLRLNRNISCFCSAFEYDEWRHETLRFGNDVSNLVGTYFRCIFVLIILIVILCLFRCVLARTMCWLRRVPRFVLCVGCYGLDDRRRTMCWLTMRGRTLCELSFSIRGLVSYSLWVVTS